MLEFWCYKYAIANNIEQKQQLWECGIRFFLFFCVINKCCYYCFVCIKFLFGFNVWLMKTRTNLDRDDAKPLFDIVNGDDVGVRSGRRGVATPFRFNPRRWFGKFVVDVAFGDVDVRGRVLLADEDAFVVVVAFWLNGISNEERRLYLCAFFVVCF